MLCKMPMIQALHNATRLLCELYRNIVEVVREGGLRIYCSASQQRCT